MIKLNTYINEAWSGVKKQSLKSDIESWCEEMGIQNYTINSQGEIDVDGSVNLDDTRFKKLPYKFGRVNGYFSINSLNLTSLENCPYYVSQHFSCSFCPQLNSLKECPKKIGGDFSCSNCKKKFTEEEVMSLCKVKKENILT